MSDTTAQILEWYVVTMWWFLALSMVTLAISTLVHYVRKRRNGRRNQP